MPVRNTRPHFRCAVSGIEFSIRRWFVWCGRLACCMPPYVSSLVIEKLNLNSGTLLLYLLANFCQGQISGICFFSFYRVHYLCQKQFSLFSVDRKSYWNVSMREAVTARLWRFFCFSLLYQIRYPIIRTFISIPQFLSHHPNLSIQNC